MFSMLSINYQSREPIYQQIYNEVLKEISLELLHPDEKLPTVRELATTLGINPNTVSKSYQLLEQNGYIYSVVGKGSFVSDNCEKLAGLKEETLKNIKKEMETAFRIGINRDDLVQLIDEIYNGGAKTNA